MLTAKKVERARKPGRYGDGHGLYLQAARRVMDRGCASIGSHTDAGSRSGRRSFRVIVSSPSRRNGGASASSV